ncbi:hypothetical protein [Companilactobacillus musae]|nr:hypothetical protein [Companilactobacillus musae]
MKFYLAHAVRLLEGRDLKQLRISIGSNSYSLHSNPIFLLWRTAIFN